MPTLFATQKQEILSCINQHNRGLLTDKELWGNIITTAAKVLDVIESEEAADSEDVPF